MGGCLDKPEQQQQQQQQQQTTATARCPAQGRRPVAAKVVKALYDFEGTLDGDLSFKTGDILTVIDESDGGWWEAELVGSGGGGGGGDSGFIPSNYVVELNRSIESQEWWFNADRRGANVQLKHFRNDVGSFMVRKTEDNTLYALSVLSSRSSDEKEVKHFRIKQSESGGDYYLVRGRRFQDVVSLVDHYTSNPLPGERIRLGRPCTREVRNLPFRSLEVDRRDVVIGERVGAGMFGDVVRGKFKRRDEVAVKMLKQNSIMRKEDFEKEAKIMHALRHPRIVQLMGICMQEEPYYIITEYMSHGSLLGYLKLNAGSLEMDRLIDISAQIADGMSYLEIQDPPYIHRDLRAANCLVNEFHIAKVADFGLAKMVDEGIYEGGETCKFPVKWTAPEGLDRKFFTVKSDVWSYGILLYEIFTLGKSPYPGWDHPRIKEEVLKGYKLKLPQGACPEEVRELKCLSWDPEERPSFVDLRRFLGNFSTGSDSYQRV